MLRVKQSKKKAWVAEKGKENVRAAESNKLEQNGFTLQSRCSGPFDLIIT